MPRFIIAIFLLGACSTNEPATTTKAEDESGSDTTTVDTETETDIDTAPEVEDLGPPIKLGEELCFATYSGCTAEKTGAETATETYNACGLIASSAAPNRQDHTYEYNADNQPLTFDYNTSKSEYEYNAAGWVVENRLRIGPLVVKTTYTHNASGNFITSDTTAPIPGLSHYDEYTYEGERLKTYTTDYGEFSQSSSSTSATGFVTTTLTYEDTGDEFHVQSESSLGVIIEWTYTEEGGLLLFTETSSVEGTRSSEYTYNNDDRPIEVVTTDEEGEVTITDVSWTCP